MAQHRFICDDCGNVVTDTTCMNTHVCTCGKEMRWDIKTGGFAMGRGDYHHVSDSLAIHPDDIPEHRQLFPNIDVTPEGRPHFTNTKQQEKYAERCGFYKKEGRKSRRKLGSVRIA